MFKVFYNPITLEIKGYSDGPVTMSWPFIETEIEPVLLWNYKIEDGQVKAIKNQFTDEEWKEVINN